jgi:hypothetical protein
VPEPGWRICTVAPSGIAKLQRGKMEKEIWGSTDARLISAGAVATWAPVKILSKYERIACCSLRVGVRAGFPVMCL